MTPYSAGKVLGARVDTRAGSKEEASLSLRIHRLESAMADENGTIRILLACGIGASTGFMAASMRKYAKDEDLNVTIHAVSKSEIMDYANKIDVLLLGPHFAAEVPETKKLMEPFGVKVMSIDPDNYAALDGEAILEDALDLYEGVLDD